MKTNKEKALDLLIDSFAYQSDLEDKVKQAIELASEPTWFYPDKDELPPIGLQVFCVLKVGKITGIAALETDGFLYGDKFTKKLEQIEAWAYLPTYKSNEPELYEPHLFYVVANESEEGWNQLSVGLKTYKEAVKFRDMEFTQKRHPNAYIVCTLKENK